MYVLVSVSNQTIKPKSELHDQFRVCVETYHVRFGETYHAAPALILCHHWPQQAERNDTHNDPSPARSLHLFLRIYSEGKAGGKISYDYDDHSMYRLLGGCWLQVPNKGGFWFF